MNDWDARTTHDAAEGPQWVSAAEAADAAGVTPGTVRYWARNGLIVSEIVPGPAGERILVRLDEVLRHARNESATSSSPYLGPGGGDPAEVVTDLPARTSELAPILKSVPEIMAQLTAATDRAARAETKVEFLSAQLHDLRRRLAEAEAETGRRSSPEPTVPEEWGAPARAAEGTAAAGGTEAAVAETVPGSSGWPAPPAPDATAGVDWGAATSDAPAGTPAAFAEEEPASDPIDWGPGAPAEAAEPADEVASASAPGGDDPNRLTLQELWERPSPNRAATPTPARSPAGGDDVAWHPPASSGAGGDEAAPPEPLPKRANATLPDEEFYGPRRRRWFRRRR